MSAPASPKLSPELVLRAYACGIFPMAESRGRSGVFWVDPEVRGVLPLDAFHVSRSLARKVRRRVFDITCDSAFGTVIRACAEAARGRPDTWINDDIIEAYCELHRSGFAHSVEAWQDGRLAGGIYGVALGGAFFGESMFSAATDASKVALVHLVARLKAGGFRLFDVQFVTEHLKQFGVEEVPARRFQERLDEALAVKARFYSGDVDSALAALLSQSRTQMS
ncbi:MAG: leucyl/phenylalanyl-tRNA--protein transferase [Proteobacteria bacterium]|nr:leucyl/phenylalanyl-tRNA--protein transferase [Pseudomonadota bacterium]